VPRKLTSLRRNYEDMRITLGFTTPLLLAGAAGAQAFTLTFFLDLGRFRTTLMFSRIAAA
jgi:hypothetical protein